MVRDMRNSALGLGHFVKSRNDQKGPFPTRPCRVSVTGEHGRHSASSSLHRGLLAGRQTLLYHSLPGQVVERQVFQGLCSLHGLCVNN